MHIFSDGKSLSSTAWEKYSLPSTSCPSLSQSWDTRVYQLVYSFISLYRSMSRVGTLTNLFIPPPSLPSSPPTLSLIPPYTSRNGRGGFGNVVASHSSILSVRATMSSTIRGEHNYTPKQLTVPPGLYTSPVSKPPPPLTPPPHIHTHTHTDTCTHTHPRTCMHTTSHRHTSTSTYTFTLM